MTPSDQPPVHVVIPTHTTRHLRRTILGVACQRTPAASLTISCDNDDAALADLVEKCAAEFGLPITLVRRAKQSAGMLNQVRNNAVRAILGAGAQDHERVFVLDGDCWAAPDTVAIHAGLAPKGELVIGFRIDLSPEQTDAFDENAAADGRAPVRIANEQKAALHKRARRYERHALMRRLRIAKAHKPKPLGAHHSCSVGVFKTVNGYDERYQGWGMDDDDFGRRVYRAGGRPVVAVRQTLLLHQHHPTRQPGRWSDNDNAKLFKAGGPTACEHGVKNPLPQGPIEVIDIP